MTSCFLSFLSIFFFSLLGLKLLVIITICIFIVVVAVVAVVVVFIFIIIIIIIIITLMVFIIIVVVVIETVQFNKNFKTSSTCYYFHYMQTVTSGQSNQLMTNMFNLSS